MKVEIDRDLIEGLNESSNRHFVEKVNDRVYELVANAVRDISEISPFVNPEKCVLVPANEAVTGAFSQLSEYDYFFGIENKQIELNSKTRKNFWKFVWREFKASWRIGRKKYKKEKKNAQPKLESIDKYRLSDFQYDMTRKLADYLSETTLLFNGDCISIVGKEDFGTNTKINIYVCCYDSKTDTFKMFNQTKNKYFDVCFGTRFELIEEKAKATDGQFVDMLKIFNALFAKNYNKIPNQILLESLLYNVPTKLFCKDDIYRTFVNVSNYLRISNPKNFVSICKGERSVFEEPLVIKSNSQVDFGKIVTMLDNYKY